MFRQNLLNGVVLAAVVVAIALVGFVTFSASSLVQDTVTEQFRSQELQFTSSLATQSETYFDNLSADIASLALRLAISPDAVDLAEGDSDGDLVAERAEDYAGVVRTIVRYDYQGVPFFAWPEAVNQQVQAGERLPFNLPSDLVRKIEGGDEVALEVELYQASHREYEQTFLLIAPVYTHDQRTEIVLYELDLDALFNEIMQVVELDEQGQLWIMDSSNAILYQANDTVPLASLLDKISPAAVFSFRQPTVTEYDAGDAERFAFIAPIRTTGFSFVMILSRDIEAALNNVQTDLRQIFLFGVFAIVLIAALTLLGLRIIIREAQRRQVETQRRETARTLLEMSRALNSTLNLEDVLRNIMAELSNIVPYDSAAILLLDRAKLVLAAHRGADQFEHEPDAYDLEKARAAHQVLQTGHPLVINDTTQDARWEPLASDSVIRSWMGVPLRVRDKTVGVLNINSHQVACYSAEEIELAEAFADQASVALQNARLHEFEVKQIEQELTIARDIQTSLLPAATPSLPQLEIATHTQPARQISGDYFQYMPMPNGQLGIAIGDVSGKGIPAAMLMAVITTALRDEVARNARPADLLDALNTRLLERMKATHVNSALMVGIFDPPTRTLELANGGMVQPYIRSGETWDFVPVGGYPLGLSQRLSYTARTITLEPDSMLLFMSDGLIEAQNPSGEFYGFERLEKLLNGLPADISAQSVIDRVLEAVTAHLEGADAQDDLTIMVIRSLEVTVPDDEGSSTPGADTAAASGEAGGHAKEASTREVAAAVYRNTSPDAAADQPPMNGIADHVPGSDAAVNPVANTPPHHTPAHNTDAGHQEATGSDTKKST